MLLCFSITVYKTAYVFSVLFIVVSIRQVTVSQETVNNNFWSPDDMSQVVQQHLLNKARPACSSAIKYTWTIVGSKGTKCIFRTLVDC